MKGLLKLASIAMFGGVLTACLLGVVLVGVLHLEPNSVIQKMNSNNSLYLLPVIILAECCLFANDLLVHLSRRFDRKFCFEFSEVRFTYDLDNDNRSIPLGSKLSQLYPLTIAIALGAFAVLVAR